MTEPNRHNDHLTANDLRNYRDKALSAAEQHRVERLLLENPLYADALEGLELETDQKTGEQNRVSDELRERLKNRVADKKIRRLPIWIPAAIASVVLALSIGWYLRMQERSEQPESMVSAPAPEISASKDAVSPAQPADIQPVEESPPTLVTKSKRPLLAQKKESAPSKDSLIMPKDNLLANSSRSEEIYNLKNPSVTAPAPGLARAQVLVPAESQTVSGRVFGEDKQPLPGVTVIAKNADQKAVTDALGHFRLDQVSKTDTLQLSSVGYMRQEIQAGNLSLDSIQLKPDTQALSEVIVVGYGAQGKKPAPGSRTRMDPAKTVSASALSAPANFKTYLNENRRIPAEAKEKGISGTVRVRFLVAPDGSVSQFSIVKSLGSGCDEEAIRLIREGPRWKNNRASAQFMEQDIVF